MIEILNTCTDPCFNMAEEEYSIKNMPGAGNYFMLWSNQPAVIVGRNQNTLEEVNANYIREHGVKVVRRMSGGVAVYHDSGNLNFTLVVTDNRDFANFQKFTRPVIKALKRVGIEAENNGRNDITIAGRKFSGNAQFKHKDRLLHHGTILFDTNIEAMVQALTPSTQKISSKGIKSVQSRVTNISEHLATAVTLAEFKQILTEEILRQDDVNDTYLLTDYDLKIINGLASKYASWAWTYGISPPFNVRKTGAFSWGNIDIRLDIKRGLIKECKIFGDFFALQDIAQLEKSLTGIRYEEEDILKHLREIDLHNYLPSSSEEEIANLLCR